MVNMLYCIDYSAQRDDSLNLPYRKTATEQRVALRQADVKPRDQTAKSKTRKTVQIYSREIISEKFAKENS